MTRPARAAELTIIPGRLVVITADEEPRALPDRCAMLLEL